MGIYFSTTSSESPLLYITFSLLISQTLHGLAGRVICTYMFQLDKSFKEVWTAKAHQHPPPPKKKVKSFSFAALKPVGRVNWLTDDLFHPLCYLRLRFEICYLGCHTAGTAHVHVYFLVQNNLIRLNSHVGAGSDTSNGQVKWITIKCIFTM